MSDSPRNPYEDDIVISWPELHRDARYLSEVLHSIKPLKGIIAVTRGGLVPAALIARELDIRLIDTVCVVSYGASGGAAEQIQGSLQILKSARGIEARHHAQGRNSAVTALLFWIAQSRNYLGLRRGGGLRNGWLQ